MKRPCSHCRRHARSSAARCPSCGSRLVEGTAPVAWALGLAMFAAGCGPGKPLDTAGETTGEVGSSSGAPDGTTTTGTVPTTSATSTTQEPTSTTEGSSGSSGCASASCGESSGSGGFVERPDMGEGAGDCDPWSQDCPKGQKCVPASLDGDIAWESLVCVPVVPDPDQIDEPCTVEGPRPNGLDSCAFGSVCWLVDPQTLQGVCHAQCTGTPDDPQCPEGLQCLSNGDGTIALCAGCDPVLQTCGGEEVCVPDQNNPDRFVCAADASGEEGQSFDPCELANECDVGLACASSTFAAGCDPMSEGCCLPFCDVSSMPPACPVDLQCIPWFEEGQTPSGFEHIGLCGTPQ